MQPAIEVEVAIRRLLDRYAHGCDTDDAALVASLFEPFDTRSGATGGTLIVRGATHAGDDVLKFYASRLTVPSLHFMTGLTTSGRSDGHFDGTCGFFAIEMPDESPRGIAGRYTDVIEVADARARFVQREIAVTTVLPFAPS